MNETTPTTGAEAPKKKGGLARLVPLAVIGAALAAFFAFDLNAYFTLDALKENYQRLRDLGTAYPVLAPVGLVVVYALLVAMSFPGASILTIVAGLMFGTVIGGIAVLFGATIGATLIFLAAKTALGESLREKAGPWLKKFESGFQENEFNYLLILRLVPAFPFWIVNLAPALLGMKLRNFVAATFIGIIPGTFVYAGVGNGAGKIIEAGGDLELSGLLLQPQVLGPIVGLVVLALIPIAIKAVRGKRGLPEAAEAE
ncbi:MAG: TVP38/TMEM64 family protein [Pseudomonadota bacterium]